MIGFAGRINALKGRRVTQEATYDELIAASSHFKVLAAGHLA
jgi:hypothetical protein